MPRSTPETRAQCNYWAKGACTPECIVLGLITQGKQDGAYKGKGGRNRIRKMKQDAKSKGCPEV